jgi:hypothetical protein
MKQGIFMDRFSKYVIIDTKIRFSNIFNEPLNEYINIIEKKNLTNLEFGECFDQPIDNLQISFFQEKKKFINRRNKPWYIKYCNLPNCLKYIEFGEEFNQPINNLPNCLKYLELGHDFNQPINNLPNTLTYLVFGDSFNQLIGNLPNSLTHLNVGFTFNKQILNLPKNIKHLELGYQFNQPIDYLPNSLTHLKVGFLFNQPIDNLQITFSPNKNNFINRINKSWLSLKSYLPNNLISLTFFTQTNVYTHKINILPKNLKSLKLPNEFDKSLFYLPQNLTNLELCYNCIRNLDDSWSINLPKNLLYLKLSGKFNLNVDNLPNNITNLKLGEYFNQPIDNLPNNLKYLELGKYFNQDIKRLPIKLKEINICFCKYRKEIRENILDTVPINCKIII